MTRPDGGAVESCEISLAGQPFTATVDPSGAALTTLTDRATGIQLLLRTPWADQRHGAMRAADSGAEWHRRYPGGWHTLIPHAGDARVLDGVEHPFHGEAAWRAWEVEDTGTGHCTLTVALRTAPLEVRREFAVDDTGLRITQTVRNFSARPAAFAWTEHPAFGPELVGGRCRLELDDATGTQEFPLHPPPGVPDRPPPTRPLTVVHSGVRTARLYNEELAFGVELAWDAEVFDHVWIWQERRTTPGFPWWGTVDTVAIEPACGPYEHLPDRLGGQVVAPGERRTTTLTLRRIPGHRP
ncbi:hypothetical protein [Streptomyces cucumeris]|uniref:hypothetical protein n=1 Tax=Streptomyces cucumeris TaxID=2962890 RepID=UPI0020C913F2|nr:hypothetical protein [Streptomyces sp. NEAU-Y11]MCP9212071.1 hypothetical protein [Streptomyces sp. NEAU-Y11]